MLKAGRVLSQRENREQGHNPEKQTGIRHNLWPEWEIWTESPVKDQIPLPSLRQEPAPEMSACRIIKCMPPVVSGKTSLPSCPLPPILLSPLSSALPGNLLPFNRKGKTGGSHSGVQTLSRRRIFYFPGPPEEFGSHFPAEIRALPAECQRTVLDGY